MAGQQSNLESTIDILNRFVGNHVDSYSRTKNHLLSRIDSLELFEFKMLHRVSELEESLLKMTQSMNDLFGRLKGEIETLAAS